ncbi:MAG: NERD domain-containing protein [Candidatus Odinarchaeota archaeon]
MPQFFIKKSGFDGSVITKYKYILEWFHQNLGPDYHVFIEFRTPGGREIDFLVMANNGAWLFEEKQHDFVELSINGPWKYLDRDGRIKKYKKAIGGGTENPYDQAINSADNFRDWLKRAKISSNLVTERRIYPCVVFPSTPSRITRLETHIWCKYSKGTGDILLNLNRTWKRSNWIVSDDIKKIAKTLDLEEIAYNDLMEFQTNLEKIFRETGQNQVAEIKTLLKQSNQLAEDGNWLFKLDLRKITSKTGKRPHQQYSVANLPLIITGEAGSGKSVISHQLLETFLQSSLGFLVPLREMFISSENESSKVILFKGQKKRYSINTEEDIVDNVEQELVDIMVFLIKSLVNVYSKSGGLEAVDRGICYYLQNRKFFLVLDGWDELQSSSLILAGKLFDFLMKLDVPFIISCREPLPDMLKQKTKKARNLKIYSPVHLDDEQVKCYIKERLKSWSEPVDEGVILSNLRKTFGREISPFQVYAVTIVPLADYPKNTTGLLRWMIIALVGWELFKKRKDYSTLVNNEATLIEILKKEPLQVSREEVTYYEAIFDYQETRSAIFPDGSVMGILARIAVAEIEGELEEIPADRALAINPLIKPFIETRYQEQGLYEFPLIKTKLLKDHVIADTAYLNLIREKGFLPLYTLDVFKLFSELLEIDLRWKSVVKGKGSKPSINGLLAEHLVNNPIKLEPTVKLPDYELIGGGMRVIQSRWFRSVPAWYTGLLTSCIVRIRKLLTEKTVTVEKELAYEAFIKIQTKIPEVTIDQIYDHYIKDNDEPSYSLSVGPDYYYDHVTYLFPEFLGKKTTVASKIQQYYYNKTRTNQVEKCPACPEESRRVSYYSSYSSDDSSHNEKELSRLSYLLSLIEFTDLSGLSNWAKLLIIDSQLDDQLILYLLMGEIPHSLVQGLLMRYNKMVSPWVDQELGVLMGGDADFDEDSIFTVFFFYLQKKAPVKMLTAIWNLLVEFSEDLDLVDFLVKNRKLFQLNALQSILTTTLQTHFALNWRKQARKQLLLQYLETFHPLFAVLGYDGLTSLPMEELVLDKEDIDWLLKENGERMEKIKNQKGKKEKFQHGRLIKKKFAIFQTAILNRITVNPDDIAEVVETFDQLDWLVKAFKMKGLQLSRNFEQQVSSGLMPKIKAYKSLIEESSLLVYQIAFCRLVKREECELDFDTEETLDRSVEVWLRKSQLVDDDRSGNYLNGDWRPIEQLVARQLGKSIENDEFRTFFSRIIEKDVKLKVLAELFIPDRFTVQKVGNGNQKVEHDWKTLSSLITDDVLAGLIDEARDDNYYFLDSGIFLLLLKLYPFKQEKVKTFISEIFEEELSEKESYNSVYRSKFTRVAKKLLEEECFDILEHVVSRITIKPLTSITYTIRERIFPESDDVVQVSPEITLFAVNCSQKLDSLLNSILSRIQDLKGKNIEEEEIKWILEYFFDIEVGLRSARIPELLELALGLSIPSYSLDKWLNAGSQVLINDFDQFKPLLRQKKQLLERKTGSVKHEFDRRTVQENVEQIDLLLALLGGEETLDGVLKNITACSVFDSAVITHFIKNLTPEKSLEIQKELVKTINLSKKDTWSSRTEEFVYNTLKAIHVFHLVGLEHDMLARLLLYLSKSPAGLETFLEVISATETGKLRDERYVKELLTELLRITVGNFAVILTEISKFVEKDLINNWIDMQFEEFSFDDEQENEDDQVYTGLKILESKLAINNNDIELLRDYYATTEDWKKKKLIIDFCHDKEILTDLVKEYIQSARTYCRDQGHSGDCPHLHELLPTHTYFDDPWKDDLYEDPWSGKDLETGIKELLVEEKLKIIFRSLFGRKIDTEEARIIDKIKEKLKKIFRSLSGRKRDITEEARIIDNYGTDELIPSYFLEYMERHVDTLLSEMDPEDIITSGRKMNERSEKRWFAFLNHFITVVSAEKLIDVIRLLNPQELESVKNKLIRCNLIEMDPGLMDLLNTIGSMVPSVSTD